LERGDMPEHWNEEKRYGRGCKPRPAKSFVTVPSIAD